MCVYVFVSLYVYMCVFVSVYVCVHMCVFVSVCVCTQMRTNSETQGEQGFLTF